MICIGLDNPKTKENVGSVLRSAYIFDASLIAITGKRFGKCITDTYKTYRHKPFIRTDNLIDIIPYNCIPIGIEFVKTSQSLITYKHPKSAFYIFGAEDNTLGSRILDHCKDVVYIPTKYCMNLAMCVTTVLYDRMSKGGGGDGHK